MLNRGTPYDGAVVFIEKLYFLAVYGEVGECNE